MNYKNKNKLLLIWVYKDEIDLWIIIIDNTIHWNLSSYKYCVLYILIVYPINKK